MPCARERDAIALMIQNEIGHANKHVFLNVGIKLPVYLSQYICRRWVSRCLSTQHAAANRHDKRGGNAFTRNIRDRYAEPFVIDADVVEVIAAHLTRRHIDPANLKPVYGRCFGWKQNTLNISCDFKVVIEPLFFVRHRVDNGVVKSKSGLFGDRFKNDEIGLRKWRTRGAIRESENTEVLISVS